MTAVPFAACALPIDAISDDEVHERACDLVRLLDGLSLISAEKVMLRCRQLIAQTHYVSVSQADDEIPGAQGKRATGMTSEEFLATDRRMPGAGAVYEQASAIAETQKCSGGQHVYVHGNGMVYVPTTRAR
ncbi:hypothetical protein [Mesorhizobium sp. 2RAF21]|uniref:hypothetical protein n=1 Tax=Mesorhizobium sp. 2RAF21 TaxID=3232995 RepID=UPI003F98ACE0